ncbi:MAG TPA: hypothetical protein VJS91_09370 [Nitrososphaeraceae archaeon]|nr:hypothetical protein [Nitrososphaeraceae archaeon]
MITRKSEFPDGTIKWHLVTKKGGSLLHKTDGPAVINSDGTKEWWFKGTKIECTTRKEFEQHMRLKAFW